MPITYDDEQWLQDAGYKYHCFISWPRTMNKDLTDCAKRLKDAIEQQLALSIPTPRVFLDENISAGTDWKKVLGQALCKSLTMVAVCAPIYYHPSHYWCGLEWSAMEMLNQRRIPNSAIKTIIPIIIRAVDPLPAAVASIQYRDFSKLTIMGWKYYQTQEFRKQVAEIADSIEQVARAIVQNQAKTECEQFQFPEQSVFSDYVMKPQPAPLRS